MMQQYDAYICSLKFANENSSHQGNNNNVGSDLATIVFTAVLQQTAFHAGARSDLIPPPSLYSIYL